MSEKVEPRNNRDKLHEIPASLRENKSKVTGLVGTSLFHIVLVVVFLFAKCTSHSVPSLPEDIGGILINFGESDKGVGEASVVKESSAVSEETPSVAETENQTEVKSENLEEAIKTQNTEEAPVVKTVEEKKEETTETKKEEQQVVNPLAIYNKRNNKDASSGEGKTNGSSNQGSPLGSSISDNYSQGSGLGFNWTLGGSGRKLVGTIEIIDESQETGKVVVEITVDKSGKVSRAVPMLNGSTTTNQYLWKLAKLGAITATFSPDPSAPEEQKGAIIFDFKIIK